MRVAYTTLHWPANADGRGVKAGEIFSFSAVYGPYTREKRLSCRADSFRREQDGLRRRRLSGVQHDLQHRSARADGHRRYELAFAGGVSYPPAGFDATVSDTGDMVFRNIPAL